MNTTRPSSTSVRSSSITGRAPRYSTTSNSTTQTSSRTPRAIQRQFHHLVRTVPGSGRLIVNAEDAHLAEVLEQGCWTPVTRFGIDSGDSAGVCLTQADGSVFRVVVDGVDRGEVNWELIGRHNVMNALATPAAARMRRVSRRACGDCRARRISAARGVGSNVSAKSAVCRYTTISRTTPSAIATMLAGLRARVGNAARILVGLEPRSNSMRQGAHAQELAPSPRDADAVVLLQRPELPWDAARVMTALEGRGATAPSVDALLAALHAQARAGDHGRVHVERRL